MKFKNFKNLGLAFVLVATLTTAANASIIQYYWVQGTPTANGSAGAGAGNVVNPFITSSGNLLYNTVTKTILSYSFIVNGAITIADTLVNPTSPDSTILGDGDLHIGFPPGFVFGLPSGGAWIDGENFGPKDENLFNTLNASSATITGDWVPVPETTTVLAGMLLLLPLGASTLKILRNRKVSA